MSCGESGAFRRCSVKGAEDDAQISMASGRSVVVESHSDDDVSGAVKVEVWWCVTSGVCEVTIVTGKVSPVSECRESVLSKVGVGRGLRV